MVTESDFHFTLLFLFCILSITKSYQLAIIFSFLFSSFLFLTLGYLFWSVVRSSLPWLPFSCIHISFLFFSLISSWLANLWDNHLMRGTMAMKNIITMNAITTPTTHLIKNIKLILFPVLFSK